MVQENMKAFGTMAEKETPKTKETQPEIKGTLTYEDKVQIHELRKQEGDRLKWDVSQRNNQKR